MPEFLVCCRPRQPQVHLHLHSRPLSFSKRSLGYTSQSTQMRDFLVCCRPQQPQFHLHLHNRPRSFSKLSLGYTSQSTPMRCEGLELGFRELFRNDSGGEEADVKAQKLPVYKKRKCQICCGVAVLLLLALAVVIVVLSQTLFKFRDPRLSIISLKLESISVSVDPFTLSATLNISVATDLGVTNPNHYDFKYSNSTALMFYHGVQIGDVALGAGEIRAEKTVALAAVVTVDALKIVEESPDVVSDLESSIVPLNVTSTIPGHVNLAGIFKHHVVATLDCNVEIWINNQTLKDYECTHHVKL